MAWSLNRIYCKSSLYRLRPNTAAAHTIAIVSSAMRCSSLVGMTRIRGPFTAPSAVMSMVADGRRAVALRAGSMAMPILSRPPATPARIFGGADVVAVSAEAFECVVKVRLCARVVAHGSRLCACACDKHAASPTTLPFHPFAYRWLVLPAPGREDDRVDVGVQSCVVGPEKLAKAVAVPGGENKIGLWGVSDSSDESKRTPPPRPSFLSARPVSVVHVYRKFGEWILAAVGTCERVADV